MKNRWKEMKGNEKEMNWRWTENEIEMKGRWKGDESQFHKNGILGFYSSNSSKGTWKGILNLIQKRTATKNYKKFGKEIWQGKLNLIQKGWGFKKIGFQDLSRWLGKETYMLQKKWVYKIV